MKNKVNLLFSIFCVVIVVPILLSLTVFHNESWCWKILSSFCPHYCCTSEVYLFFYIIIIPLISLFFSLILKTKKNIVIPIFMSLLVFFFIIGESIWYDISHGYNVFEHNNINYVLVYFMMSIPTFIGSIIGISIRKLISKLKNKYFN